MGIMSAIACCAVAGPNDKVRHGLEIEVDESIGKAAKIRYTYGDEFVDQIRPVAIAIGAFKTYIALMHIPEKFQISWEATDGSKHEAKCPSAVACMDR